MVITKVSANMSIVIGNALQFSSVLFPWFEIEKTILLFFSVWYCFIPIDSILVLQISSICEGFVEVCEDFERSPGIGKVPDEF